MTGESEDSENTMNLPDYKSELARKCVETDGIVTEIDKRPDSYEYHAGVEDLDGIVWKATIEVTPDEGLVGGPVGPQVRIETCNPGTPAQKLYSWTEVTDGTPKPTDLDSWRWMSVVFETANELLKTHSESGETATASPEIGQQ